MSGVPDLLKNIEKAERTALDLKEHIREAHEATQGMRDAKRALDASVEIAGEFIANMIHEEVLQLLCITHIQRAIEDLDTRTLEETHRIVTRTDEHIEKIKRAIDRRIKSVIMETIMSVLKDDPDLNDNFMTLMQAIRMRVGGE